MKTSEQHEGEIFRLWKRTDQPELDTILEKLRERIQAEAEDCGCNRELELDDSLFSDLVFRSFMDGYLGAERVRDERDSRENAA
jgi:hypothetical protein